MNWHFLVLLGGNLFRALAAELGQLGIQVVYGQHSGDPTTVDIGTLALLMRREISQASWIWSRVQLQDVVDSLMFELG